jgi:hypothetical protein
MNQVAHVLESLIGGFTAITCGSLWLVNSIDRRVRSAEQETRVRIFPFQFITDEARCPICGGWGKGNTAGPQRPAACPNGKMCLAYPHNHLHVHCTTCESNYFMKAAFSARQ